MVSSTFSRPRAGRLLIVPMITALAAACGQTPSSGTSPTFTTLATAEVTRPASPDAATNTPSSAEMTTGRDEPSGAMPPSALEKALITEGPGTDLKLETKDTGTGASGGLDLSLFGQFVSGDDACREMFDLEEPRPGTYAGVLLIGKDTIVLEVIDSYEDVAEARRQIDATESALKTCSRFTMNINGEHMPVTYGLIRASGDDDREVLLHELLAKGRDDSYAVAVTEMRSEGEVMHVIVAGRDDDDLRGFAANHFTTAIKSYRDEHPRG